VGRQRGGRAEKPFVQKLFFRCVVKKKGCSKAEGAAEPGKRRLLMRGRSEVGRGRKGLVEEGGTEREGGGNLPGKTR